MVAANLFLGVTLPPIVRLAGNLTFAHYLVLYVISQVHFFFKLQPYLFTTYIGYWRLLFREEVACARYPRM